MSEFNIDDLTLEDAVKYMHNFTKFATKDMDLYYGFLTDIDFRSETIGIHCDDDRDYNIKFENIASITVMDKDDINQNFDNVNHPQHYQSKNGLEVIDVIDAFTDGLTGMEAVCTGNALKYICRWKNKNGIEDIKKAIWYLNKLIEVKENE